MTGAGEDGENAADRMASAGNGRYTLTAWLPNREQAGEAVERLRAAGFAPGDAVILGGGPTEAGIVDLTPGRDRQIFLVVFRDSLAGTWLGALVGAVLGVLIAAAPPVRDSIGHGLTLRSAGIAAVLGAVAGTFGGSLLGMVAALDRGRAGSDTYDDQLPEGATLVGVYAPGVEQRTGAARLLAAAGATHIEDSAEQDGARGRGG